MGNILKKLALLINLLLLIFLSGCGFHLRGQEAIPVSLKSLYISANQPYDQFNQLVKSQLQGYGVKFENQAKNARYILHIANQQTTQQLVAISENSQVRTYIIIAQATFTITTPSQKEIVPAITLSSSSTYTTNDNQLLGDTQILNQEKKELYRDIIFRFLTHLNARDIREKLT